MGAPSYRLGIFSLLALVALLVPASASADDALPDAYEPPADRVNDESAPQGPQWFPRLKALSCRPTVACGADIAAPGVVEAEAGYTMVRGRTSTSHSTPILLKLSMLSWLQLQVASNGEVVTTGIGASRHFDDVGAGLKARFVQQSTYVPSVSISAHFMAPTAPALGYARDWDSTAWFYASKDIGRVHADFNVAGYALAMDRDPTFRHVEALAVSVDMPLRLTPMAEVYRFSAAGDVAPADAGFLFALAYAPRSWLVFDVAGDVSFYEETRGFTTQMGMTIVPADLWETSDERRERLSQTRLPRQTASMGRP